ncbi:thiazole synthase [Phyllobacterium sp. 21LDTY02-6]|jgi:thiazole synthase|uniref:thiazole synthase n=1 Tax=unclassified Phyllobacterium TaxID=2638441 RepID=UPI0020222AC4|nr:MULTISPECIES: thiazole synthase [unclassified Phyllobacterium]MCO4316046.1 thiazole synthase [Phyllobacterium sp. 21LDTY02-6]MCX8279531.1 thiazole synthase [Phyllobacterium sp. 0TCS1.6C]MCX8292278.1 thiazole synthase [Phyllobacterium sp. 0TCS1.6A]
MLDLYGEQIASRLLLGTAQYPSPAVLAEAVKASGTGIVTVSLRRETAGGKSGDGFWSLIQSLGVRVLPNTAGCHTVKEAVLTAHMARDLFRTDWIKLEVIGNHDSLQPDVFALVEAARILTQDGFKVFPYTTDDLVVAERLLEAGCEVLMPWCAPIGSAMGPVNPYALRSLRGHFPAVPLIVDAGIGRPSHACSVMELGFDAVLLNTAVAKAGDPVEMAAAFAEAVNAGHRGYRAQMLEPRDFAVPSTPVIGKAVFS